MATLLAKTQEVLTERNKLTPNKIKGGETVFGVTGDYVTDLSNLSASKIKKGVTINNVTGTYSFAPSHVSFYKYPGATINFDSLDYIVPTTLSTCVDMFYYAQNLTSVDLSRFNTSSVTSMMQMFYSCRKLSTIIFGSNWDTSNATSMSGMFNSMGRDVASSTVSLDLSRFNTSKVTTMNAMFMYYGGTSLNLSSFNTSNVTDMNQMFQFSKVSSLDLSSFNTSKVQYMTSMFADCSNLTSLDLSSFDTNTRSTRMSGILSNCPNLTTIKFGENWKSYDGQTYTNQTTGTWTRSSDGQTYTGLEALLEAGRTKGAIAGTWTKS